MVLRVAKSHLRTLQAGAERFFRPASRLLGCILTPLTLQQILLLIFEGGRHLPKPHPSPQRWAGAAQLHKSPHEGENPPGGKLPTAGTPLRGHFFLTKPGAAPRSLPLSPPQGDTGTEQLRAGGGGLGAGVAGGGSGLTLRRAGTKSPRHFGPFSSLKKS